MINIFCERDCNTLTINFDMDQLPRYTSPLNQYYGIEYRLIVNDIQSIYYLESNRTKLNIKISDPMQK